MKKRFTAEKMEEVLCGGFVTREFVEKRRWYSVYRLVFEDGGRFWSATAFEPATECQEGIGPFPDESPEDGSVECREVEPYEKAVTAYRIVKDEP